MTDLRLPIIGLLLTLLASPSAFADDAIKQKGEQSDSAGQGAQMQAIGDLASGLGDCICMGNGKPCPKPPSGACMINPMNIAAILGMMTPQESGKAAAKKSGDNGFGGPGPGLIDPNDLNPDMPITDCRITEPNCNPQLSGDVQRGLDAFQKLAEEGKLEGIDPSSAAAETEKIRSGLETVVGHLKDIANGQLNNTVKGLAGGSPDADAKGRSFYSGAGGGRSTGSDGEGTPGAPTLAGNIRFVNRLEATDNRGKPLTIFQRATRRFRGEENGAQPMRALFLARTEALRQEALRKVASSSPGRNSEPSNETTLRKATYQQRSKR